MITPRQIDAVTLVFLALGTIAYWWWVFTRPPKDPPK